MNVFLYRLFGFFPALGVCFGSLLMAHRPLHYLQLESYQFAGYFKTLKRQWKRVLLPCAWYTLVCVAAFALYDALYFNAGIGKNVEPALASFQQLLPQYLLGLGVGLLCASSGYLTAKICYHGKEKKPFAKTKRMVRLYIALGIVLLIGAVLVPVLLPLLLPLLVALAAVLALPVERFINHLYFKDAEKKLMANERLIRIGITGSYGKTSTKFILATILSQKFNVLATPASFNTPMGVTRVIRERLTASHQVFIGEMGARHVGEIKELCGLVHPTIGILTSVGPQHLDTFGTLENIRNTKYELIDALPADGLAVFSDDDAIVTELYDKTDKPKLLVGKPNMDAWAQDVSVTQNGSEFTLCIKGEAPVHCVTKLLGAHNIRNILVASAVGKHLGLTMRQILAGIAALEPVEHRMQIVSTAGGVTVIDDAFNTNPRSSKEALSILKSFTGRRIIVTPGMVELGADEARFNQEFGREMASSVDLALLIGKKHAQPIKEGLLEAGFDAEQIHMFDDLSEAVALLQTLKQPGDVVLYENDLPDHYTEN